MTQIATLPRVDIELNGRPLAEPSMLAVQEIQVSQLLGLPAQCEIVLERTHTDQGVTDWRVGAALRINVPAADSPLFVGEVTAISTTLEASGRVLVRVRAYDRLHRLRKQQSLETWEDVSVADLAQTLAPAAELDLEISTTGPRWPLILNRWPSDFALLADIAWQAGLYPQVRDRALLLISLEGEGAPISLRPGGNLLEVEVEENLEHICHEVAILGWSALSAENLVGSALGSAPPSPSQSGGGDLEPAAPSQASSLSAAALDPAWLADELGKRHLLGRAVHSAEHADALAQAEMTRRAASARVLHGTAEGTPNLSPGARVVLEPTISGLDGVFVLTEVTHRFTQQYGYLTTLGTAPPQRPQGATPPPVVALGIVQSVEDPLMEGRVRVTLPAFGEVRSIWMQVLLPAAGSEKGLVMLPDADDHVVILLPDGDPGQGIVLGGLYGAAGAPLRGGVEGAAVRRYAMTTRTGARLELDEHEHLVRLRAENGSMVELGPSLLRIFSATDTTIEAPGRALVIRAKSVDFQQATEVER